MEALKEIELQWHVESSFRDKAPPKRIAREVSGVQVPFCGEKRQNHPSMIHQWSINDHHWWIIHHQWSIADLRKNFRWYDWLFAVILFFEVIGIATWVRNSDAKVAKFAKCQKGWRLRRKWRLYLIELLIYILWLLYADKYRNRHTHTDTSDYITICTLLTWRILHAFH